LRATLWHGTHDEILGGLEGNQRAKACWRGTASADPWRSVCALTRERLRDGESFVAVLEVCGFNDWLIRMLRDYRCHKVIMIQPDDRKRRKTDRRDAAALSPCGLIAVACYRANRCAACDRSKFRAATIKRTGD
jgi:hypothetical protein